VATSLRRIARDPIHALPVQGRAGGSVNQQEISVLAHRRRGHPLPHDSLLCLDCSQAGINILGALRDLFEGQPFLPSIAQARIVTQW